MKKSALVILGLLALSVTARAQDEKFKALFMYNFTKYIEWPQAKQNVRRAHPRLEQHS